MRYSRGLRIIPLMLACTFFIFDCTTGKSRVIDTGFSISAEAVPEGILIHFYNIPPDTVYLFVSARSFDEKEWARSVVFSHAHIADASFESDYELITSRQLERVKQTGRVILPFVQAGKNHEIVITIRNKRDIENASPYQDVFAQSIAGKGIFVDGFELALNDTNSAVTVISEPVLPSEITFAAQKYNFNVVIMAGRYRLTVADDLIFPDGLSPDGLSWTFQPQMTDILHWDDYLDDYLEGISSGPAWVEAFANILHDDIIWSVTVAKTPEFTYSL